MMRWTDSSCCAWQGQLRSVMAVTDCFVPWDDSGSAKVTPPISLNKHGDESRNVLWPEIFNSRRLGRRLALIALKEGMWRAGPGPRLSPGSISRSTNTATKRRPSRTGWPRFLPWSRQACLVPLEADDKKADKWGRRTETLLRMFLLKARHFGSEKFLPRRRRPTPSPLLFQPSELFLVLSEVSFDTAAAAVST